MSDTTWLDIAKAIASTKLTAINAALTAAGSTVQLREATAEVPDSLPGMLPGLIVFPPAKEMQEEGQNEFYDATFNLVIPVEKPGDSWAAIAECYAIDDALWVAFRTGRQLGLAGTVIDSHLTASVPDELAEWGDKTIGIRASCIVEVRRTITRTP